MCHTVIFDIGKVLVDYFPMEYLHKLFPGDEDTVRAVWDAIWASGLWTALDGGADTEETLSRMCALAPGKEGAVRLAFRRSGECLSQYDYTLPWLRELKARALRLLFLSNYSDHTAKSNPEALSFLPLMDGGIFSWKVKLLKPDPAIYAALRDAYSLIPAECVFLDDRAENVRAAREFGLNAIQFEDYADARKKLERFL